MLIYYTLSNKFKDSFIEYNCDVYPEQEYEMIDPEEHKAHFLKYCSDPAVQEEELYPYDDYTYPVPEFEEE